jgi:exodeoxyribonuclease VII small subunit
MKEPTQPPAEMADQPDFESCMNRLEQVVQELEGGQVPLERAMALFEEALRLGQSCRTLLDAAQVRVDKLLERADGGVETQQFEP